MNHFQPQPAGLPSGSFGRHRGAAFVAPSLRRLLLAPHRLAFAAGSLLLVAAALWWAGVQLAPALGQPLPLLLSADAGVAWLLALGAWPLFLAGLLCAALPRWLDCPPLATRLLLAPLGAVGSGWALALVGLHTSSLVAALGLAAVAVGLALLAGLVGLTWLEHRHRATGPTPAPAAIAGLVVLAVAAWGGAVALALGQLHWLHAALQLALWLGLVPLAAALLHADGSRLAPAGTRLGWLQRSTWAWLGIAAGLNLVWPDAAPAAPLLMGCLASLVMARATAELLQQAGQRPRIDNTVWFSVIAAQLAALAATLAPLWTSSPSGGQPLALLAAQFWLGAVALWAWHLRPGLLRLPTGA
jgi:uncharacterized protein involved in response to NO